MDASCSSNENRLSDRGKAQHVDSMMAQFSLLEKSVARKEKFFPNNKKKKCHKILLYRTVNKEIRTTQVSRSISNGDEKVSLKKTCSEKCAAKHFEGLNFLKTRTEDSKRHEHCLPIFKVYNIALASGLALETLDEKSNADKYLINPARNNRYTEKSLNNDEYYPHLNGALSLSDRNFFRREKGHKFVNKKLSSSSPHKLEQEFDVMTKSNNKCKQKSKNKPRKFAEEYDDDESRSKVSAMGLKIPEHFKDNNSNESELQICADDYVIKENDRARISKEGKMKHNTSHKTSLHGDKVRNDSASEKAQISNASSTRNEDTKYECNDISEIGCGDTTTGKTEHFSLKDSPLQRLVIADATQASNEVDTTLSAMHEGITDDAFEATEKTPQYRIVKVKASDGKSIRKQRQKPSGSSKESDISMKKQSSSKGRREISNKTKENVTSKNKDKLKYQPDASNSRNSFTKEISVVSNGKQPEEKKLVRNQDGYYFSPLDIQKIEIRSKNKSKEKRKKKQIHAEQQAQSSYSKKSSQPFISSCVKEPMKSELNVKGEIKMPSDHRQVKQADNRNKGEKSSSQLDASNDFHLIARKEKEAGRNKAERKLKLYSKPMKTKLSTNDGNFGSARKTGQSQKHMKKKTKRYDKSALNSKGLRKGNQSNWHTGVPDFADTVRAELRESKYLRREQSRIRRKSDETTQRCLRASVSADSESSFFSTGTSSQSTVSSTSRSSSEESSKEHDRNYNPFKYNNNAKSRLPPHEKPELKMPTAFNSKTYNAPRHQRSASSTSSFQRHSFDVDKAEGNIKQMNNADANKSKSRYENAPHFSNRKTDKEENSPPSPPADKLIETRFGKRRTRPPNGSIEAEGEGGNTLWQNQHLVLISQKPETSRRNTRHVNQTETSINQLKYPVSTCVNPGSDKRLLTIRNLYTLHNVLSDTQNGTVISGYRRSDGMRVAIKRISKSGTTRWGWLGRKVVPLELSLLCQVNETRCSGVIDIVEWHETSEAFLLVMARPHPAVDLYDYVSKHKRIKETYAKHIIRQLVTALQHCINNGVLHRDVKLENILLNPHTMEITLIDFGCGDYIRNGSYKEFAGTPEYYPPEWFSRKQYKGEPMTAWSIGVLLYSLVCGSLPFRSGKEIQEKEANKFPSEVSRAARDVVSSLLEKNPRERLALNSILSHSWFKKSEYGSTQKTTS